MSYRLFSWKLRFIILVIHNYLKLKIDQNKILMILEVILQIISLVFFHSIHRRLTFWNFNSVIVIVSV